MENPPKGEIVLMVAPPEEDAQTDYTEELIREIAQNSLKTAVKNIVDKYKLNKNEIYQAALELKNGK